MSGAFTRENDESEGIDDIVPRPISPHRNLVTPEGLKHIEHELEKARAAFGAAERKGARREIAIAARDLNYWSARRASAELIEPIADTSEARFGHTVSLVAKSGKSLKYKIVGEDEADPAKGLLPHVAPLAQSILGKGVGESVNVMHEAAEITDIA